MCGIFGMVALGEAPLSRPGCVDRMATALRHRGPDQAAVARTDRAVVGATRLSIVDRRPTAGQPLAGGAWILVVNGEIYNAPALRDRFARHPYRTRTDVEPLLPLIAEEGPGGLDRIDGMFALAAWNECTRTLVLARDRAGEKPLFYRAHDDEIWFASEIQGLLAAGAPRDLDPDALLEYVGLGYTLEPHTLFRGIRKVPAGQILTFRSSSEATHRPLAQPHVRLPGSFAGAARHLGRRLETAVTKQLRADVPVGVFLSGGMDSALLAALARAGGAEVHTFTAGFDAASFDERNAAHRVAGALGTRHSEVRVTPDDLIGALDTMVATTAEPLADPAVLPTLLLARHARERVGAVLSGEGADELFGGYPTYLGHRAAETGWGRPLWGPLARLTATGAAEPGAVTPAFLAHRLAAHAPRPWLERHLAWFGTGWFERLPEGTTRALAGRLRYPAHPDVVGRVQRLDFETYLREGLLVKLDRSGMAVSLETRSPFLDPWVVAFARAAPTDFHVRGIRTKRLLRAAARPHLPAWVLRRRKHGFSVPIADLLNREFRSEADRLLAPERFEGLGVLSALPIRELLSEHRAGRANHARPLWAVAVLSRWLEHWLFSTERR